MTTKGIVESFDKDGKTINIYDDLIAHTKQVTISLCKVLGDSMGDTPPTCPAEAAVRFMGIISGCVTALDRNVGLLEQAGLVTPETRAYIERLSFDMVGQLQLDVFAGLHGGKQNHAPLRNAIRKGDMLITGEAGTEAVDKSKLN